MHTYPTPGPVRFSAEIHHGGDVVVVATDTAETTVELVPHGRRGEDLLAESTVEQRGDEVLVRVPRGQRGLFSGGGSVDVRVTLPTGSDVRVDTDSGDVRCTGTVGTVAVRTGSGDVDLGTTTGPVEVSTGSGDIVLERAQDDARCTTGSGDVRVEDARAPLSAKTGSGDLRVDHATSSVELKSGSGDLTVDHAEADAVLKSGSGDLTVRRVGAARIDAGNASGSIHVGVTDGVPAWLDLTTVTGRISSDLGDSEPASADEPYLELRARTVSGDVTVVRA